MSVRYYLCNENIPSYPAQQFVLHYMHIWLNMVLVEGCEYCLVLPNRLNFYSLVSNILEQGRRIYLVQKLNSKTKRLNYRKHL